MENEQRIYEIGYLLSPLIPEEKIEEEIGSLRKIIENKKGLIMSESRPKLQKLAYPIKGNESAYFGWFRFNCHPETILEIKNSLEKEKIIRFLLTQAVKERLVLISPKKARGKKKAVPPEIKQRGEIKLEEIDKKLEELLKGTNNE